MIFLKHNLWQPVHSEYNWYIWYFKYAERTFLGGLKVLIIYQLVIFFSFLKQFNINMIEYDDTDENKYLCNMIMYNHCKYSFCLYIHIILMLSNRSVHWHLRDFRPLLWHWTKTNCYNKSCNDSKKKKERKRKFELFNKDIQHSIHITEGAIRIHK